MFGIALAAISGVLLSFADAGKKSLTSAFSPEMIIFLMFSFGVATNLVYLMFQGSAPIAWESVWIPARGSSRGSYMVEIPSIQSLSRAQSSMQC
jgi:hypothetical protein